MSKYLDHIGKNLPKHSNQEEYGFISNPFAEGGMLEVLNPVNAWNYYAKKGVSDIPGAFVQEVKDYDDVRKNISDRPGVLRRAALKIKDVPFNMNMEKKITNYRGAGWANVVSQSPTSKAEAYAIVAAMYYMTANIYGKPELISMGDRMISASKRAPSKKDVKGALEVLNKGVDELNKDAKKSGAVPAWYNIIGKVNKVVAGDIAFDQINKYAKALNSVEEVQFAEAMRAARMEDSSPMGQLVGSFGVVIGGIVLFFTAPYWMPVVGNAASAVGRAIPGIAKGAGKAVGKVGKGAGKLIGKTSKSVGNTAKNTVTDMAKDVGTDLIETAKKAVEDFDVDKFSNNVNKALQNLQKQGKPVSQKALMQSQEVQKMFQKFLENQSKNNKEATKQEMRKLLKQLLLEINS